LESELSVTHGLYHDEFGAEEMATEIIEWWNSSSCLQLAKKILSQKIRIRIAG